MRPILQSKRSTISLDGRYGTILNVREDIDKLFWILDDKEVYLAARYVGVFGDQCAFELIPSRERVKILAHNVVLPISRLSLLDASTPDLVNSEDVSEPGMLWIVRKRFDEALIYTNIGNILISINPYQVISSMYSDFVLNSFTSIVTVDMAPVPHIWAISRAAYKGLVSSKLSQVLIISGESGSGKTEATKKVLYYFAKISSTEESLASIESKIVMTNPVLEAWGNARTVRNNNSSRFGKWIEIQFSQDVNEQSYSSSSARGVSSIASSSKSVSKSDSSLVKIVGAKIYHYLLEKSRIVQASRNERSYHIFYQLCSGLMQETSLCDVLGLPVSACAGVGSRVAESFRYLSQSGCLTTDGMDDAQSYGETRRAMASIGFTQQEVNDLIRTTIGVLHLGNISFVDESRLKNESPGKLKAKQASSGDVSAHIDPRCHSSLNFASALLSIVDIGRLGQGMCSRIINIRSESVTVALEVQQAEDSRDALAKAIYSKMFKYIVDRVNVALSSTISVGSSRILNRFVGVLDIFGFEIFDKNSFEQLCINYANEKLQRHFIQCVLADEEALYFAEGVEIVRTEYIDNQSVLDLFEILPNGIFPLLDEEIRIPRGSDNGFLSKIKSCWSDSAVQNSRFRIDIRMSKTSFGVKHYAGEVIYDSNGFLAKNRDALYDHLSNLFLDERSCRSSFMRQLFSSAQSSESTSKKSASFLTQAGEFTEQLSSLMEKIQSSNSHFVRCIKPNESKSPRIFDSKVVIEQLRYSGVLETITIRRNGYPCRKLYDDFVRDYWMCCSGRLPVSVPDPRQYSLQMLESLRELESRAYSEAKKPSESLSNMTVNFSNEEEVIGLIFTLIGQTRSRLPEASRPPLGRFFSNILQGRTMVLYKPEHQQVFEALLTERRSYHCSIIQSSWRMVYCLRKLRAIKVVRDGIVAAATEEDADKLHEMLLKAQEIQWDDHCIVIRAKAAMSTMLERRRIRNLLHEFIDNEHKAVAQSNAGKRKNTSSSMKDPVEEFQKLSRLIDDALSIGIKQSEMSECIVLRNNLEQRATVVSKLNDAVAQSKKDDIISLLMTIEQLEEVWATFGEHEVDMAHAELNRIGEEERLISSLQETIKGGQIRAKLPLLATKKAHSEDEDDDDLHLEGSSDEDSSPRVRNVRLKSHQSKSDSGDMFDLFQLSDLTAGTSNVVGDNLDTFRMDTELLRDKIDRVTSFNMRTPDGAKLLNIGRTVLSLRECVRDRRWNEVQAIFNRDVRPEWLEDDRSSGVHNVAAEEMRIIMQEVDRLLLIPKLCRCLSSEVSIENSTCDTLALNSTPLPSQLDIVIQDKLKSRISLPRPHSIRDNVAICHACENDVAQQIFLECLFISELQHCYHTGSWKRMAEMTITSIIIECYEKLDWKSVALETYRLRLPTIGKSMAVESMDESELNLDGLMRIIAASSVLHGCRAFKQRHGEAGNAFNLSDYIGVKKLAPHSLCYRAFVNVGKLSDVTGNDDLPTILEVPEEEMECESYFLRSNSEKSWIYLPIPRMRSKINQCQILVYLWDSLDNLKRNYLSSILSECCRTPSSISSDDEDQQQEFVTDSNNIVSALTSLEAVCIIGNENLALCLNRHQSSKIAAFWCPQTNFFVQLLRSSCFIVHLRRLVSNEAWSDISMFLKDREELFQSENWRSMHEVCIEEASMIRDEAVQRTAMSSLLEATTIGGVVDSGDRTASEIGGINFSRVSTENLVKTIKIVTVGIRTFKSASFPANRSRKRFRELSHLLGACMKLVRLRHRLLVVTGNMTNDMEQKADSEIRSISSSALSYSQLHQHHTSLELLPLLHCSGDGDWQSVSQLIESITQHGVYDQFKLEIQLIEKEAKFQKASQSMFDALIDGMAIGQPGQMDYTCIKTKELEKALVVARGLIPEFLFEYDSHITSNRPDVMKSRRRSKRFNDDSSLDTATEEYDDDESKSDQILLEEDLKCLNALEEVASLSRSSSSDSQSSRLSMSARASKHILSKGEKKLADLIEAGEVILRVRQAILANSLTRAIQILDRVKTDVNSTLLQRVPLIADEIDRMRADVSNSIVIKTCMKSLRTSTTDQPIGKISRSSLNLDMLEKAMQCCATRGCRTAETEALFRTVNSVFDIRKAVLAGDWSGVKDSIESFRNFIQSNSKLISSQASKEIDRFEIELLNRTLFQRLRDSILSGCVCGVPGNLILSSVKCDALSKVIEIVRKCAELSSSNRWMLDAAECIFACRSNAVSGDPKWRDDGEVVRKIDSWKRSQKRRQDWQSDAVANDADIISVGCVPRNVFRSVSYEISVCELQSRVANLRDRFTSFLATGGMKKNAKTFQDTPNKASRKKKDVDPMIDISTIETSDIEGCILAMDLLRFDLLEWKREYADMINDSPVGEAYPCDSVILDGLYLLGSLVLKLRKQVLLGQWDEIEGLLIEYSDALFVASGICWDELHAIILTSENKRILKLLTETVCVGAVKGALGALDLAELDIVPLTEAMRRSSEAMPQGNGRLDLHGHQTVLSWKLSDIQFSFGLELTLEVSEMILFCDKILKVRKCMLDVKRVWGNDEMWRKKQEEIRSTAESRLGKFRQNLDELAEAKDKMIVVEQSSHLAIDKYLMLMDATSWSDLRVLSNQAMVAARYYQNVVGLGLIFREMQLIRDECDSVSEIRLLKGALESGQASGTPGMLDISSLDAKSLDEAAQNAIENSVKSEYAHQLLVAVRTMKLLRSALKRMSEILCNNTGDPKIWKILTQDDATFDDSKQEQFADDADNDSAMSSLTGSRSDHASDSNVEHQLLDSWRGIQSAISTMDNIGKRNPSDSGWICCQVEVELVRRDKQMQRLIAHANEVKRVGVRSFFEKDRGKEDESSTKSRVNSTKHFEYVTIINPAVDTKVLGGTIARAEWVLFLCSNVDFTVPALDIIHATLTFIVDLRRAVVASRWPEVVSMCTSDSFAVILSNRDLQVMQEASLSHILATNHLCYTRIMNEFTSKEDDIANDSLELVVKDAMEKLDSGLLTSRRAKRLVEAAKNVVALRKSLVDGNEVQVGKLIKELSVKSIQAVLPDQVKAEIEGANGTFRNIHVKKLLLTELSKPPTSNTNDNIMNILEEAEKMSSLRPETEAVMTLSRHVINIRKSQRLKSFSAILEAAKQAKLAISSLQLQAGVSSSKLTWSDLERICPQATREVDSALESVGNIEIMKHLSDSLKSFTLDEPSAPQMLARPMSNVGRKYSMANINAQDIDPESITTADLDQAIHEAEVFNGGEVMLEVLGDKQSTGSSKIPSPPISKLSSEAIVLLQTVKLIRHLRYCMKRSEWLQVDKLLRNVKDDMSIHPLGVSELEMARIQLSMRASVVELATAQRTGWIQCTNSVIDTSSVRTDQLRVAIVGAMESSRRERPNSRSSLQLPSESPSIELIRKSLDNKDIQKIKSLGIFDRNFQVLVASARAVLEVREAAMKNDLKTAIRLSKECLSAESGIFSGDYLAPLDIIGPLLSLGGLCADAKEELTLYAKEFEIIVQTDAASQSLCSSCLSGNDIHTGIALDAAQSLNIGKSHDLSKRRNCLAAAWMDSQIKILRESCFQFAFAFDFTKLLAAVSYCESKLKMTFVRTRLNGSVVMDRSGGLFVRQYRQFAEFSSKIVSTLSFALTCCDFATSDLMLDNILTFDKQFQRYHHVAGLLHTPASQMSAAVGEMCGSCMKLPSLLRHPIVAFGLSLRNMNHENRLTTCLGSLLRDNCWKKLVNGEDILLIVLHQISSEWLSKNSSSSFSYYSDLSRCPCLRSVGEFNLSITSPSRPVDESLLRQVMVCPATNPVPTSLTSKIACGSHFVAAAVRIFQYCVLPLSDNSPFCPFPVLLSATTTNDGKKRVFPEVLIRQLLCIGKKWPIMRDELILMIVKQLNSPDTCGHSILWLCLKILLNAFSPSADLFTFVDVFCRIADRQDICIVMRRRAMVGDSDFTATTANLADSMYLTWLGRFSRSMLPNKNPDWSEMSPSVNILRLSSECCRFVPQYPSISEICVMIQGVFNSIVSGDEAKHESIEEKSRSFLSMYRDTKNPEYCLHVGQRWTECSWKPRFQGFVGSALNKRAANLVHVDDSVSGSASLPLSRLKIRLLFGNDFDDSGIYASKYNLPPLWNSRDRCLWRFLLWGVLPSFNPPKGSSQLKVGDEFDALYLQEEENLLSSASSNFSSSKTLRKLVEPWFVEDLDEECKSVQSPIFGWTLFQKLCGDIASAIQSSLISIPIASREVLRAISNQAMSKKLATENSTLHRNISTDFLSLELMREINYDFGLLATTVAVPDPFPRLEKILSMFLPDVKLEDSINVRLADPCNLSSLKRMSRYHC